MAEGEFRRALKALQPKTRAKSRRWLLVPYDQLSDQMGPLAKEPADSLGIILVENAWKAARRPYHRQKLAAVLTNLRHFALEQAARGVRVDHRVVASGPYRTALQDLEGTVAPVRLMRPAEWELRDDLRPLVERGTLEILPHEGWLTTPDDFRESQPRRPYRMDRFYRRVRTRTGILMTEAGKPEGGRWSFDTENRKRWPGSPPAPALPRYDPDPVTREVGTLIEERFARHPGTLDLTRLPATATQAQDFWSWAKRYCLPLFGPYEDAMSDVAPSLFHSRTSLLLNLGRLLPQQLVKDVERMDIPLASKEGFIRQLIGWREFMHHVHEVTDGFREVEGAATEENVPRDGGYQQWAGHVWETGSTADEGLAPTATPSALGAHAPLPPMYWGKESGLHCVDTVVESVWQEGYSHHITRLMVLSNLASLLDVSPRQLTDWFWVAYVDAYDWVVEPNVLAMGTWALEDLVVTKPYVASANYINKMSDYCKSCAFDPRKNCPITRLYWAFLERHRAKLTGNPRLFQMMRLLDKRSTAERKTDAEQFDRVQRELMAGKRLSPG